jgi:hypothetical protein
VHRIFIDEVGNHDLGSSDDPNHRHLGLTGVIMTLEYERTAFTNTLSELKQDIFGSREIILHRREVLDGRPPFDKLADPAVRERFDEKLLRLVKTKRVRACADSGLR